mmetsp:Transcript_38948/g.85627  ORF Transcript_38948/g.85627 Transcript_38948/m.85627 type:complete len:87 (+) Transcript_38948:721-981(+)
MLCTSAVVGAKTMSRCRASLRTQSPGPCRWSAIARWRMVEDMVVVVVVLVEVVVVVAVVMVVMMVEVMMAVMAVIVVNVAALVLEL